MGQKSHLLEAQHVSQIFNSGGHVFTAVDDINLAIDEGDLACLLGPSGCGKSTLLRIFAGLQRPSKGQVLYRGEPLRGVNPHATIVFQTFALFPWLTVQENVEVALKARGVPPKQRTARAVDLLDRVGLDGFETAYPRELSGGMRQKVGFARAMAVEPELLCMDEPFSALDVLSAEALRSELLELWTEGKIPTKAILMVTHNIEEAVLMADRIVVMDKNPGRVVDELRVDLPHPRHRKSSAFTQIVDHVYAVLVGQTQPEAMEMGTAPGEAGLTRALPHVAINDLSGFLKHLARTPEKRHDVYHLAAELKVRSEHLLRLTEAAEFLRFATLAEGDITLTSLGKTFAEARILARKEVFAARLRQLPIFRWLLAMLEAADDHQMEWDVVLAALELEFHPEEAKRQLDTLIDWGRYAELITYDKRRGRLFLEPAVFQDS